MEGLYKRVIKGQYHRIPTNFSPELSSLIKVLLSVDPASRPTVEEVLNMRCMKQRGEPMKKLTTSLLIETIKDPKDFQSLKHVLPKANFDDSIYHSVKDIPRSKSTERKMPSATSRSSLSLLARNQSQSALGGKGSILPLLPSK
jgi:serine/threonine protein kinase